MTSEPLRLPMVSRCGRCDNCRKLLKARASCLRALTSPGSGEHVRIVWNDMVASFPCTGYVGVSQIAASNSGSADGFRGNTPVELKTVHNDGRLQITNQVPPPEDTRAKCARTVCQNKEDGWVHTHNGDAYCAECVQKISLDPHNAEYITQFGPLFVKRE